MENAKTATTNGTFNAPEVKLHFLDYWRIIRIRKTVILAVFLLVTITTTIVTFILPKTYASTVRMKVEKDAPDVALYGRSPVWQRLRPVLDADGVRNNSSPSPSSTRSSPT